MQSYKKIAALISGYFFLLISTSLYAREGGVDGGGLPDHALMFCFDKGGIPERHTMNGIKESYCHVDNAYIGAWPLYFFLQGSLPDSPKAIAYFLHPTLSGKENSDTPEAFCIRLDGKVVQVDGNLHLPLFCEFSDRSQIDVVTLFLGPDSPSVERLTKLLLAGEVRTGASE
ncbi:MAG: hypothetical protein AB7T49_17775 [Oligoflexales bacterium]